MITVSILYFIIWKKAILRQEIIVQNAYWQLKTGHLNYFHSYLYMWSILSFVDMHSYYRNSVFGSSEMLRNFYSDLMIFIGLVKLWQCPLVWSEGQGSWEIVSAA